MSLSPGNRWHRIGHALYRDGQLVGVLAGIDHADELVEAVNAHQASTRVDAKRPGGGSRYIYTDVSSSKPPPTAENAPKTIPGMRAVSPPDPETKTRRRTSSAQRESLLVYYRRIIAEEGAEMAVRAEAMERSRHDPKVVRFLEAREAYNEAQERRDRALRDLGSFVSGEKPSDRP